MSLSLLRQHDRAVILSNGILANSYWTRLRGLIGKTSLTSGEGILITRSNSVHMWMMSIPIDVVFLKTLIPQREWRVVAVHANLKPWKLLPVGSFGANDTLELPSGAVAKLNLKIGEVLCIAS